MNVARQARQFTLRAALTDHEQERVYLLHLCELMRDSAAQGRPQPAKHFLPMFVEEFDKQPPSLVLTTS